MKLENMSAVVTGGASGLGLACTRSLAGRGVCVVIADLNEERGNAVTDEFGGKVRFVKADVTDADQMNAAYDAAEAIAPLRALIHCAGLGGRVRLVEKDGSPGSLEVYERIVRINLIGTFNTLRLAAARMARNEPVSGERGACVLTASVAAFEGQIGQIPYASAKAGVVGMTLVAARDLAQHQIRVCTIAPGLFDTPLLDKLPENVRNSLGAMVPHPARLGAPDEYASTALHILENSMLNGETIRLDGAIRMAAR
ncbi:NAD(P)-dependent dehydrogenase (short-subunit alcohol dehydrogenase family) [Paraburkholderia sp. HC6.4b]|uniref:SDR family NAD(P)-dependent oxidoreductase n=1 Tax=unclassified Paraburkholderia TaxID=2615204 RepID=UPI001616353B|nr:MULTISPECIES: SDR family NAD(P)-dependent oxidoreductase [unclassified Paraburkholderia]MBB5406317.1 NAD(P)-dependent dehydrogenase (short-subunit alcohol dehydrogenase family) [Paraburkholderia sp. HC6.4b]MBB5448715.1 NAD(P)-dependent dehydrogenase (short-subunit alcohol dehydrogenase family) [Paraburkholderia sp. Kb1A]